MLRLMLFKEPLLATLARSALVFRPAALPASVVHRAAADCLEEPGERVVGNGILSQQFDQRFLQGIFGRFAPLPRVKHQGGAVGVDQLSQLSRIEPFHIPTVADATLLGHPH